MSLPPLPVPAELDDSDGLPSGVDGISQAQLIADRRAVIEACAAVCRELSQVYADEGARVASAAADTCHLAIRALLGEVGQ